MQVEVKTKYELQIYIRALQYTKWHTLLDPEHKQSVYPMVTHQWGSMKKIEVKHDLQDRLNEGQGQNKIGELAHLHHVCIAIHAWKKICWKGLTFDARWYPLKCDGRTTRLHNAPLVITGGRYTIYRHSQSVCVCLWIVFDKYWPLCDWLNQIINWRTFPEMNVVGGTWLAHLKTFIK